MDFTGQVYPTVEETIINNASVLYRRKKHFLTNLRQLTDGIGYVVIGLIYFRDILFFFLVIRLFTQYCISNPYPTPSPTITISDAAKKRMNKFILVCILSSNVVCFLRHLLFGVYTESPYEDGYLYGGMTVQFIGEQLPKLRIPLLGLDVLILFIQIVYHSLMCCTDDTEVLKTTPLDIDDNDTTPRSDIEADGYNGNVSLIAIDIFAGMAKTLLYNERGETLLWEMSTFSGEDSSAATSRGNTRESVLLSQLLA